MEDTIEHQSANTSIKGSSKAVLVTGGAGYVGSHTCKLSGEERIPSSHS